MARPTTQFAKLKITTTGNETFSLDNVYITPTPEPETYALMVTGLSFVAALKRKKKKS